jgi:hypothetical protein
MSNVLVVPSNRPDLLRPFTKTWREHEPWDAIVIVEDGPSRSDGVDADVHVCWNDIEAKLGVNESVICRRYGAVRVFGFLLAYEMGADVIYTLDDDCLPVHPFIEGHRYNIMHTPKWVSSVPGGMRSRGLPYYDLGELLDVKISHGLWNNVPDLDAVQTLAQSECVQGYLAPPGRQVIPAGTYFPFCSMNVAFTREATPLMYFPRMGAGTPYGRFDDIWCGVIAKRICDHLGWSVVTGEPHVYHTRASDTMSNLVKEAPGIARNETFWRDIEQVALTATTAAACMREVGQQLCEHTEPYMRDLGRDIVTWAGLFP